MAYSIDPPSREAQSTGVVGTIARIAGDLRSTALSVAMIILVVVGVGGIVCVLAYLTARPSIQIDPIEVPKSLQDRGYTPPVAARLLRDALSQIKDKAKEAGPPLRLEVGGELPEINIPGAGVSISAIVAYLRAVVPGSSMRITGQISDDAGHLKLRLGIAGRDSATVAVDVGRGTVDDLFLRAGEGAMSKISPFVYASYLYSENGQSLDAVELLKKIATSGHSGTELALKAYSLWGYILGQIGADSDNKPDARAWYQESVRVYREAVRTAVSHNYLDAADILATGAAVGSEQLEDRESALSQLCGIIREGRLRAGANWPSAEKQDSEHLAFVYQVLGRTLRHAAQDDDAHPSQEIVACFERIGLPGPYSNGLCRSWTERECRDNWSRDQAIEALRRAIVLYPSGEIAKYQLASTLRDRGRLPEAIELYHEALDLQGDYPAAYYGLGLALRNAHQWREAAKSFQVAISQDNQYGGAHFELANIYKDQSIKSSDPGKRAECLMKACQGLSLAFSSKKERPEENEKDPALDAACHPSWTLTNALWELLAPERRRSNPSCDVSP